jgi:hypothetical protein
VRGEEEVRGQAAQARKLRSKSDVIPGYDSVSSNDMKGSNDRLQMLTASSSRSP